GEVAVAEERAVEIEEIGTVLLDRLCLAVGDIGADRYRKMIGCDAPAMMREAIGEMADDVVLKPARREARRDRGVVLGGEVDRLLAADDGDPDRRVRLLHRAWPDRHVLVGPELAGVGEHLLG